MTVAMIMLFPIRGNCTPSTLFLLFCQTRRRILGVQVPACSADGLLYKAKMLLIQNEWLYKSCEKVNYFS
jgi:hypothetical protein